MIRQIVSLLLSALLVLGLPAGKVAAHPREPQATKAEVQTARIKDQIARILDQTYVRVRLHDGTEQRGRLLSRAESQFQLQNVDTIVIAYADVKSVKVLQTQQNLTGSPATRRLLIGVVIVGAILGIAFWAASQTK